MMATLFDVTSIALPIRPPPVGLMVAARHARDRDLLDVAAVENELAGLKLDGRPRSLRPSIRRRFRPYEVRFSLLGENVLHALPVALGKPESVASDSSGLPSTSIGDRVCRYSFATTTSIRH
jgi:hypothetical protein